MPRSKHLIRIVGVLVLLAATLAACTGEKETPPAGGGGTEKANLIFATNPVGSGLYTCAVGIAGVVMTQDPNIRVVVQPCSNPEGYTALMESKDAHISWTGASSVGFFKAPDNYGKQLRAIYSGQKLNFGFVTHTGTGIKKFEDLKGKRLAFAGLSSTHELMATCLLRAHGMDPEKDVVAVKMEFATTAMVDLIDGRVDAVIASLEGSKMEELAAKKDTVVVPLTEEKAKAAAALSEGQIVPSKTKEGVTSEVPGGIPCVAFATVLGCQADIPEETVYKIVKIIVENNAALVNVSSTFKEWSPEEGGGATTYASLPYHEGAIKYFKEKNLWTEELEAHQKGLVEKWGVK